MFGRDNWFNDQFFKNDGISDMSSPFKMLEGLTGNSNGAVKHHRSNRKNNNGMDIMNFSSDFGNMGNMMAQFQSMDGNGNDPNGASFSSATVMSYTNDGQGPPQVYKATNQVSKMGDMKETRKAVKDSRRQLEKMAIGRHIKDQSHVIQRQRHGGGPIEEEQNLENLDDTELPSFNQRWENSYRNPVDYFGNQPLQQFPQLQQQQQQHQYALPEPNQRNSRNNQNYY
ncbi:hypothetical protein SNEBB_000757 [Seison nebaliae]|nr:hypothetical protein SNEBB_000757 [Seison nebaliae]